MTHTYLIALGSNMRVVRIGSPRRVLAAALCALDEEGVEILSAAPVMNSAPIGPSLRRYANSAALVAYDRDPPHLLKVLQRVERRFGRTRAQRRGQRWRARALDLDIVLWSGGVWQSPDLGVPHREMRSRDFVLKPALAIARNWHDPVTGLSLAHLHARLTRSALTSVKGAKKALNRTRG